MYHLFCILVNASSYKVPGCMITIKLFVKAFGVCTVQYLYSNFFVSFICTAILLDSTYYGLVDCKFLDCGVSLDWPLPLSVCDS